MTLHELRLRAAQLSGLSGPTADPEFAAVIDALLNSNMQRYAKLGRIPRMNEDQVAALAMSLMRTPQVPDGLFSVVDLTNKRRIPVYDVYTADNLWPDRNTASPGKPRMAVWNRYVDPGVLQVFPAPSEPTQLRIFYAYVPPDMVRDDDEPWHGQLLQFHDLIAFGAAYDWAQRRLGEDAADGGSDQNPYAPLNFVRGIDAALKRREAEFLNATARIVEQLPTADPWNAWRAPGYAWTDPALPTELAD